MTKVERIERIVPDTSVIVEGLVSLKIEKKEIKVDEIIIHEAVFAEIEHQANEGKAIGFVGLDELKKIKELSEKGEFALRIEGKRPSANEIKYAGIGEIDAMIRQLAYDSDSTLMTADKVQARVAVARGIKCLFIPQEREIRKLKIESYFDENTMSVHLRENNEPYAKKGKPGSWDFVKLSDNKLTQDEIKDISREIIEEAKARTDGFIEIERPGSTIIQLGNYRIVTTKPPFSDGWEITAVRPVKKLSIDEYKISEKLKERITKQAEGILIAGAPGMGKSTFAQALAEFYANKNKIVKTVEAPRDLILPDNITQYSVSHGSSQEIHDILLLSRPDYTLFDEMRNTEDFRLFADLRLSGVGMVGVIHATKPIDAIQRFIGRIELGVIPHVIDTVIFIKNGNIDRVFSVQMVVKVPVGMTEADLARPVVVVNDFETGKIEFEIYSYGEETVVIPVSKKESDSGAKKIAGERIRQEFEKIAGRAEVEFISDNKVIVHVPSDAVGRIIGEKGKNIERLEKKLGIGIDVREFEEKTSDDNKNNPIPFKYQITKKGITFFLEPNNANKDIGIYLDNEYLLTAKVGKDGSFNVKKNNKIGKIIIDAANSKENLEIKEI